MASDYDWKRQIEREKGWVRDEYKAKLTAAEERVRVLEKALRRFMRMVEGDTAPGTVHSCMEQGRAALSPDCE